MQSGSINRLKNNQYHLTQRELREQIIKSCFLARQEIIIFYIFLICEFNNKYKENNEQQTHF